MLCYECGQPGHIKAQCPNRQYLGPADMAGDSRPMWCGGCDERSRHIELTDGRVKRCRCHPESHKRLPQHRVCPGCGQLIVSWDAGPCGQHSAAATVHPYVGPPVKVAKPDNEDQLRQVAAVQVVRARIARLVMSPPAPA